MKRYPILILAYKRTTELELALESLKQLNPSIVYFHLHNAPEGDIEGQKQVEEVKKLIVSYQGAKEVRYVKEALGVRASMYSALDWISEKEETFFVWEDDIILKQNSAKKIEKYMTQLEKEDGVVKIGKHREWPVYWGWATTAKTAKRLIDKAVWELPEEIVKPYYQDVFHYKGTMELHKRGQYHAWDDEFGLITKILGVNEILSKEQLTDHIGYQSTRDDNWVGKKFGQDTHVTYRNGVLVPQENNNA